jgi:hypothetical protein
MLRRSEPTQLQRSNSTVLSSSLHEQRDGTTARDSGTNVTRSSLGDDSSPFPDPSDARIPRLEAELAQARREADEGTMELQRLRAEVARLTAGSPALPSNLMEFGFVLPQDSP